MTWQGIPLIYDKTSDTVTVAIDKLPAIIMDSAFPWDTLITAFAAIFAAAIPGWIAFIAIRKNFELATYQTTLATNRELAQKIRSAGAEHITDVVMLSTVFEQWHKASEKNLDNLLKGIFPDEINGPIKAAETSKNKFLLLISPDEIGCKLIEVTVALQQALTPCLKKGYFSEKEKEEFRSATNNFIFGCHEYIHLRLS